MIGLRTTARVLAIAGAVAAAPAPASARPVEDGAEAQAGEVERCDFEGHRSSEGNIQRAAEHYDRGLVLYEQGDYEGAIAEFVAGYCDAPNPIMFYNIAQSYERLLDYDKAVAYFERFLRESSGESTERNKAALRVKVLEQLPARIQVATVPPGIVARRTITSAAPGNVGVPSART